VNGFLLFFVRRQSSHVFASASDPTGASSGTAEVVAAELAALSMSDEFAAIRRSQELEVQQANEKLWRRNLLYQFPLLKTCRRMVRHGL
jgi:hypothetical protein